MTSLLAPLLALAALAPGGAHAQPLGIPKTFYPAHQQFVYDANVSNAGLDCGWGLDCSKSPPAPVLHCSRQDALGRTGGWLQVANGSSRYAPTFAITVNSYPAGEEPSPVSVAQTDLVTAAEANGFTLTAPPSLRGANVVALRMTSDDVAVYLLGAYVAGTEVEAYVMWTLGHNHASRLKRDLIAQVEFIL